MDYKPGFLMPVDELMERSIREGIENEGIDQYYVRNVRIRERAGVKDSRVFVFKLEFTAETAITPQVLADCAKDPLVHIGRQFARNLQRTMITQIPIGIGCNDKLMVPEGEYRELKRRALLADALPYNKNGKLP